MNKYIYDTNPRIRYNRSQFILDHGWQGTANVGDLVPMEVREVLPGDSFKYDSTFVLRMSSNLIRPTFGNLYADIFYFFVPNRLLFDESEQVFGNPSPSSYYQSELSEYPVMPVGQVCSYDTIASAMGIPTGDSLYTANNPTGAISEEISVLPFRAYALIVNNWFRNQNIEGETYVPRGARTITESLNNLPYSASNYTGKPYKVTKRKDYFTSALPNTQKGDAVSIPLTISENVPVKTGVTYSVDSREPGVSVTSYDSELNGQQSLVANFLNGLGEVSSIPTSYTDSAPPILFNNLWAQTDGISAGNITINDLRYAFAAQRLLEKQAMYGSRYTEILASQWGITAMDSRLQIPEYLGGKRVPIRIEQVTQTANNSEDSNNVGSVGAYSLSAGNSKITKSFTEHGFIIGLICIRQVHSYQQGLERMWTRKSSDDFYNPSMAGIGMQPIYKTELYAGAPKDAVFGYKNPWDEYRTARSYVTGQLTSKFAGASTTRDSLDVWHLADFYTDGPTLNSQFIKETPVYLDRVLEVSSDVQAQFIIDGWHKCTAIRELPTFGVPNVIGKGG